MGGAALTGPPRDKVDGKYGGYSNWGYELSLSRDGQRLVVTESQEFGGKGALFYEWDEAAKAWKLTHNGVEAANDDTILPNPNDKWASKGTTLTKGGFRIIGSGLYRFKSFDL